MNNAEIGFGGDENAPWRVRLARTVAGLRSDLSFAAVDAMVIVVAYSAALVLRFIDVRGVPENWIRGFALALPFVLGLHLGANLIFGAYGHVWEYASVEEAMRLVFATASAAIMIIGGIVAFRAVTGQPGFIPLTVAAAGSTVALGGMGALRFRSRLFSFKRMTNVPEPLRTLVVGTGRAAAEFARHGSPRDHPRTVVGFVSMNGSRQIRRLAGKPILGSLDVIPAIVPDLSIDEIVVSPPASDDQLRHLVDSCMQIEVRLRILPDLQDSLGESAQLTDIRDLELSDLLPRPTVSTDLTGANEFLTGKRVLVTGAGGSIGSEMVRQLL
ncbi:MAG: hypothetical protein U9N84_06910, partial [Actinomycetota bacterium]|nr:hypothetical protein [Actinomycetota bacterium]